MNYSKTVLSALALLAIVTGCKKENSSEITGRGTPTYKYFTQLKVGNYWIYDQYKKHNYTGGISENTTDSVYISKDTTVNGKEYFMLAGTNSIITNGPYYLFLRDSAGYIVDENGDITEYKLVNYTDTVLKQGYPEDNPMYSTSAMWSDQNKPVTTTAGTFTTSNFKITLALLMSPDIRVYINNYYAYSTGLIKTESPDFADPLASRIRELKRYHFN